MSGGLAMPLKVARRELRGGLGGFRIFLACLALGVGAIAAVGSLSEAFLRGLAEESRAILGGDVEVELTHRAATQEERAYFDKTATAASEVLTMRANVRPSAGGDRLLVELKGADAAYPMVGGLELEDGAVLDADALAALLAPVDGRHGAVVAPEVLRRLDLSVGDALRLGTADVEVRGAIGYEPDQVAGGFGLGPRVLVSRDGIDATGLVQQGSLIDYHYRLLLPPPADQAAIDAWTEAARQQAFAEDWDITGRSDAAAGARRFVDQLTVFLTLVGLTALVVGGVGVSNAVKSYLDGKREVIATLKTLGARGQTVFAAYLAQVMALAAIGIAIGLVLGAGVPFLVAWVAADLLPIPAKFGFYPVSLLLAAAYGILVALAFAVWPLARAREIPAATLFRDLVTPARARPRTGYVVLTAVALLGLVALALGFTANRTFAGFFVLGAVAVFALLWLTGRLVKLLARLAGRPKSPDLRIALTNLYRPGAPTGSVVLSLGLGLTLLVIVALIDGNISAQVEEELPEDAPAFFVIDIQKDQMPRLADLVTGIEGAAIGERVANLRGRVTAIDGVDAEQAEVAEGGRWALSGDRGITYAAELPDQSALEAGDWWPADYDGPPLVSVDAELARAFGVGVGDTLTFNILGREITAEIASTRALDWGQVGFNYLFVMSPGVLEAAPHTFIATIEAPEAAEDRLEAAIAETFPNITLVRTRAALERVSSVLGDIATAIRAASSVTLVAGILVLAGALAAGFRQRVYDAVVLKVLGATRGRILRSYLLEYAFLGLGTAAVAAGAGTVAAWLVVTEVMQAEWRFRPVVLALTVLGAAGLTVALGLAGTWRTLGQKAAPVLRAE